MAEGEHAARASAQENAPPPAMGDKAQGGANGAASLALRFLMGEVGLSDPVLVGLHQALVDPRLVAAVLEASQRGGRMAARVTARPGRSMRDVVLDPAFEWAPPGQHAHGATGNGAAADGAKAGTAAKARAQGDGHAQVRAAAEVQGSAATTPAPAPQADAAPAVDPHASVDQLPKDGQDVRKVGVVGWDKSPPLRLRSTPVTDADNVITALPFNTHLQVIKRMPGDWYFVSTGQGAMGYVASTYVKTDLPEPEARIHRVESGLHGFAIAIAEQYYRQYANDWGQDLRFYVNVLAWVNHQPVPDDTDGWKSVAFQGGDLIWVPSHDFARSLKGVVNSGSISYNLADSIGIAGFLDRVEELWDDFRHALDQSLTYLPGAIARHAEAALVDTLVSLAEMLIGAAAILAISTAIGAAVGALAGGVGAAPGAAAGFEVGMALLDWLGLAFLVQFVAQAIGQIGGAFGDFLGAVWGARGMDKAIDLAGKQFAEAIGTLVGVILQAIAAYAAMKGLGKVMGELGKTKFFQNLDLLKLRDWLARQGKDDAHGTQSTGGGSGGGGGGGNRGGGIVDPLADNKGSESTNQHGGEQNQQHGDGKGETKQHEHGQENEQHGKEEHAKPVKYPKSWDKFAKGLNEAFRERLARFRGNDDLAANHSGGEGRIFRAGKQTVALKRWFESRLGDMPRSLELLEQARAAVDAQPKLAKLIEVVKIYEQGPDWILRDYDLGSLELNQKSGGAGAKAARAEAIAELDRLEAEGKLSDVLRDLRKKLKKEPPSANLHWSDARNKIIVIDMQ